MNPPRLVLLLTCLVVLAFAASASASSIVYVKDGNVWLTSPDGATAYQVTSDGGYSSPSQSDDGTIVALQGKLMVRMDRSGHRLNEPVAGVGTTQTSGGDTFYGRRPATRATPRSSGPGCRTRSPTSGASTSTTTSATPR
jgi:hypothetical protein